MNTRLVIAVLWIVSAAVPYGWWAWNRRRVDIWKSLPVPAALLDSEGRVVTTTGPDWDGSFDIDAGVPARGQIVRGKTGAGTPVALAGVRGGALAVALPADPLLDRRDHVLADLSSRVAHDIYTPLASVLGHLDLVAHEPITDAARNSIAICLQETERIATLSRDLLALSSIRAGRANHAVHNAGILVEEAAIGLLGRADQLGATIAIEVPTERLLVDVSDGDLIRALRNLINNALDHGLGERRHVDVRLAGDEDTVRFTVVDSGPGLPHGGDLTRLTVAGQKGDGSHGSGLGLTIVKEVLAAHGSSLAVRNGDGAEFTFALPRVRP